MRSEKIILRSLLLAVCIMTLVGCQSEIPGLVEAPQTQTAIPTSLPLTDTPVPTLTPTLRPSSTPLPTLTLAPSLTPIPTDTPTPAIFGLGFTSGPFRDDFSDPGTGWVNEGGENWSIGYFEGGYRIVNDFFRTEVTAGRTRSHTDFIVEVDVDKLSGSDSAYFGVYCRKSGETYFTMAITGNGGYKIVKTTNDEVEIVVEGTSPVIRKGNAVNHIKGSCVGNVISLSVNNADLATYFTDGPLFGIYVGILVGTVGDAGIAVKFDNFNSYPTGNAPAFPTITPTEVLSPTPTESPTATP